MTPLPAVPGVVKIVFGFDVGLDVEAIVRNYWTYTGPAPDTTALSAMASGMRGGIGDVMVSLMDPDTTFTNITILDLSSDLGAEGVGTGTTVGTRAGGKLGAGSAVLANYTIGRRYRGGHPRSYWPWGTSTDLDTRGIWSSDALGAFGPGANEIVGDVNGASSGGTTLGTQVSVSYYTGVAAAPSPTNPHRYVNRPVLRAAPLVDAVSAPVINPKVASQRRRDLQRR